MTKSYLTYIRSGGYVCVAETLCGEGCPVSANE